MRLRAIKLAGFKSFVDPTTVSFPSNLCAVVGPNGCGKSNIIDAVRWVMGESSAKNLRGESMADVIFNGSTSRQPIGQASIELIFDNSEGRLVGEFASYTELSIQRKVTRDGQSIYSVNGQKCRRKDITDIFLGTGLGPRSYSIIEQGMISELIEAKPEELRIYIEEAAGISRYKDRRRETERRISRTRDNLDRLTDLREELERQIHHLKRQARAAERYTELKSEERLLKAQLQALHWIALNDQVQAKDKAIGNLQVEKDAGTAELRAVDLQIEKTREMQAELSDQNEKVQKRYYDVGTEIARIEESIQYQQDRAGQLESDLEQVVEGAANVENDLAADRAQLSELSSELAELEPNLKLSMERATGSSELLTSAQQRMSRWQEEWDAFNDRASQARQQAEVEQSRITHLEQSIARLNDRLGTLQDETARLDKVNIEEEIAPLSEKLNHYAEMVRSSQAAVDEVVDGIGVQRETNHQLSDRLDETRASVHNLQGRKSSLEALQQAALGQDEEHGVLWLEEHGLTEASKLAEITQVDEGWELAVETVLGDHLQAVCVDDIDLVATLLGDAEQGSLAFLEKRDEQGTEKTAGQETGPSDLLAARVKCSLDISSWLAGVRTSENLLDALEMRKDLKEGESVITPEGIWFGENWLRVAGDVDPGIGIIKRQQELTRNQAQLAEAQSQVERTVSELEAGAQRLTELEEKREELQRSLGEQQKSHSDLQAELSGRQVEMDLVRTDRDRTAQELHASQHQVDQDLQDLRDSRQTWQKALDEMARDAGDRERLLGEREETRTLLEDVRVKADADREEHHGLALRQQSISAQIESINHAVERLAHQQRLLADRKDVIERAIAESDQPRHTLKAELERQLTGRLDIEKELGTIRRAVEEKDRDLRDAQRERSRIEEKIQQTRSSLEEVRMEWQALDVRRSTVSEQLAEEGFELERTVAELPEDVSEEQCEAALTRVGNRLQRLGAINLAAIEEYNLQSERKQYLDAQNEDLEEALTTLQNAIRRIDRETRTRFKETFDEVNKKLQQFFPKLFGGGHAYLQMTGEDLLDTGVSMLARPPGKRNTSIQSLSGGEKALSAIALVFAIFSLNPAPFCMLDEVDAPLDDTNTGRYCDLVKEMSRTVQFIFITHNKIAMEMAHQMMGVTMDEPGVSRLVSVDVDEAVALATV